MGTSACVSAGTSSADRDTRLEGSNLVVEKTGTAAQLLLSTVQDCLNSYYYTPSAAIITLFDSKYIGYADKIIINLLFVQKKSNSTFPNQFHSKVIRLVH